ncbi:MAG: chaperone modulator CbpM [Janthinobacterium lividum]
MKTVSVTTATVVSASHPLRADELARACGADLAWVVQLVEIGILEAPAARQDEWRFHSSDLGRAREARRLQRDFDASLDAAALILDMSAELRRLRTQLRTLGFERP